MAPGQPLPADESDAVERHLREYDRLTDDLRVVERELARDALADPNVKRLMTIPGIDMVVAVGLMAAIGPVERFPGPDRLVAYLGLNPTVHQSGEGRPRHGRITKQGRTHARTMLVEAAWQAVADPGPCGPSINASQGAAATTSRPSRLRANWPSSSGICSRAARTTPGCGRHCTPRSFAISSFARASRRGAASGVRLRVQSEPNPRRGEASRRAGRDRLSTPDRRLEPTRSTGAHGRRKGGATMKAARPGSHLTPGSSPRGRPWATTK